MRLLLCHRGFFNVLRTHPISRYRPTKASGHCDFYGFSTVHHHLDMRAQCNIFSGGCRALSSHCCSPWSIMYDQSLPNISPWCLCIFESNHAEPAFLVSWSSSSNLCDDGHHAPMAKRAITIWHVLSVCFWKSPAAAAQLSKIICDFYSWLLLRFQMLLAAVVFFPMCFA